MEFNELKQLRRSTRDYAPDITIPEDTLRSILQDTLLAPTWKNNEGGRYYVINQPALVKQLREECLPSFNQKNTANASTYLVTTFPKKLSGFMSDGTPNTELGDEWGAYDLGCQISYLLLSAKDKGYDGLIMGIRDEKALRSLCSIPEEEAVMAVIALGKAATEPEFRKRKPIEDVCKFL